MEALRAVLLALPIAFTAWIVTMSLRRGAGSLAGALEDLTLAPLEISVAGGALLCGTILVMAVRQHLPRERVKR